MDGYNIQTRALEDPDQFRQARRVTWIGLGVNLLLAALKMACGVIGTSQALVADAFHSLSDSATDLAILIGIPYWSAPADAGHPHGHRRIETVVTVAIAVVLASVAMGLAFNALVTLKEQHTAPPGWVALVAALLSIAFKEALYRRTVSVAKRVKSTALMANAWHHRSDALSSVPVVVAVGGAMINPAWAFLDHVGAVVVSVLILGAAWRIGWPALKQLVDTGASEKELEQIRAIALGTPGVRLVHAVRTRYVGPDLSVDLHVMVDGSLSVRQGHDISEEVKRRLLADGPSLVDVVVHLEPCDEEEKA